KIELFLFNSNKYISSVKKWSSQDEGNSTVFFHFENNKISRKGEFTNFNEHISAIPTGLMLAPRSAKALQEKVLLKLGGTLFWIIAELSSLKKAAEICSILCSSFSSSLSKLIGVSESLWSYALLGLVECYFEEIQKVDQIAFYHRYWIGSCLDYNHYVRLNANYRDSSLGRGVSLMTTPHVGVLVDYFAGFLTLFDFLVGSSGETGIVVSLGEASFLNFHAFFGGVAPVA
ncbi:hypothetical protein Tco_1543141, partial [Tanacetum coccineum]